MLNKHNQSKYGYEGFVDLNEKLAEWQKSYNLHRPHGTLAGFTPFEVLMAKLKSKIQRLT